MSFHFLGVEFLPGVAVAESGYLGQVSKDGQSRAKRKMWLEADTRKLFIINLSKYFFFMRNRVKQTMEIGHDLFI